MPEFKGDVFKARTEGGPLKAIMHYQYASMSKDDPNGEPGQTIFSALTEAGIEPSDYISFCSLRKWQPATDIANVTELIYVHSKLLIVDDKHTIIGSANFNDRSQEGCRDSEFCLYFKDTDESSFAKSLRLRLWSVFLGVEVTEEDLPESGEFYEKWTGVSQNNTDIFEEVFKLAPTDVIHDFDTLEEYGGTREGDMLEGNDPEAARARLEEVSGVLSKYLKSFYNLP